MQLHLAKLIYFVALQLLLLLQLCISTQSPLPHVCETIKCPTLEDIKCPDDSDIREILLNTVVVAAQQQKQPQQNHPIELSSIESSATPPLSSNLIHGNTTIAAGAAVGATTLTTIITTTTATTVDDTTDYLYSQCCLAKKCACRTCYIPNCDDEYKVVVELQPESMDRPGHCCGRYECQKQPNCTAIIDTTSYWLTNCQRCKCFSGELICHQSCDEVNKKSTAICNSKTTNTFYEHGATWKDGCYECECVNGEEKCVLPFCKAINCSSDRQVLPKNSCCPICWPENITMPHLDNNDEHTDNRGGYDDDDADVIDDDDDDADDDDDDDVVVVDDDAHTDDHDNVVSALQTNELENLTNIVYENTSVNIVSTINQSTSSTVMGGATTTTATQTNTALQTTYQIRGPYNQSTEITNTISLPSTTTSMALPPCMANPNPKPQTNSNPNPGANMKANLNSNPKDNNVEGAGATQSTVSTAAGATSYSICPEVLNVVRQTQQLDFCIGIIIFLVIFIIGLIAWNFHLRARQRSYCPVSNFDDNFNKVSSNIKKVNDYV